MTEADILYLAGFFDGEGCCSIARNGKTSHVLRVSVANSHVETLAWIQEVFGGRLYVYNYHLDTRPTSHSQKWKPQGVVVWQAQQALPLLKLLVPHLRVRKVQALLGMEFQEQMRRRPGQRSGGLSTDNQRAYWLQMRTLNARGVRPS